jgi:hypothetical protein
MLMGVKLWVFSTAKLMSDLIPQHESGNLPIMPKMCSTCPFGDNDALGVRAGLEQVILKSGRLCHSSHLKIVDGQPEFDGYPATHVCRGALARQAEMLQMILTAPTVEAWEAERERRGMPERKPCDCAQCRLAEAVRANL